MLALAKHDVSGLRDYLILAICLSYFEPKRYDEKDTSREIIKLKWSIIIKHYKLTDDRNILERFRNWRNHLIGVSLHSLLCMSYFPVEMKCNMLNQKIAVFTNQLGKGAC